MLSELKILKTRIDKNIVKLETIVPHSKDISNDIEILLQKNADDTMIQSWLKSIDDFMILIERKSSI